MVAQGCLPSMSATVLIHHKNGRVSSIINDAAVVFTQAVKVATSPRMVTGGTASPASRLAISDTRDVRPVMRAMIGMVDRSAARVTANS